MSLGRRLAPERTRKRVLSVARYPRTWRLAADLASFRAIRRLENPYTQPASDDPIPVRVRPLSVGGRRSQDHRLCEAGGRTTA